mgnify:CR=1 FL=1
MSICGLLDDRRDSSWGDSSWETLRVVGGFEMTAKTLRGETRCRKYCQDCPAVEFHITGSLIWLSCKHADGWRSIDSECVL